MTCELKGLYEFELFNEDGSFCRSWTCQNGVTTPGVNDLLTVAFAVGTQKTSWFIGLINNNSFSTLSSADTMASHSGWTELTDYTESTRQTWSPGTASGGSISNTSVASFTINANSAINGAFMASSSGKLATTGILYSTGSFATVQNLIAGQVLRVTYTITLVPN
ncbi:MAG: hypothetical protein HC888_00480 [Candidatus Competibacteraceae bacterium]|nr:hypothetical protein [Candidatus Competibacteraceae bacterium]